MQNKLLRARTKLLMKEPFYGSLIMRMKFALAPCGTACTDMRRVIFDPAFLSQLSEDEVLFVLKHEVLHCVLQHGIRARGYQTQLYNIAADIVVNSSILHSLQLEEFSVHGEKVMHLAPDGKEGRTYTTEQVYRMLLKDENASKSYGVPLDNHGIWEHFSEGSSVEEEWNEYVKDAIQKAGTSWGMPEAVRAFLEELDYESRTDWRVVLHDFMQMTKTGADYTFTPPDRRFSEADFFLPSFTEMEEETVDNLWFLIDTSGSITDRELSELYTEVKVCMSQFPNTSVKLSFFDTKVHGVMELSTEKDLKNLIPVGGGGTSFKCIFQYMKENMEYELPTAILVLTDGCAWYPNEEAAMGVPVLWVLTGMPDKKAPWGKTVHI